MWQFWLVLAGIFLVIEIVNLGFMIFWFSIGSLIAMIFSFCTDSWLIQSTIFLVSSTLLLFATKPFVNKLTKKDTIPTNVNKLCEAEGIVTEEIDPLNGKGKVKVNKEIWSAVTVDNSIIPLNTKIIVEKIDGVKAIVKIKNN